MTGMSDFDEHCRKLTEQFLQTAIVVDDEAFMGQRETDIGELSAPTRRRSSSTGDESDVPPRGRHSLDANAIINSFAGLGIICGMVGPEGEAAEPVIRQADIVVLDWQLRGDDGERTLDLMTRLLEEESARNALRLVAVYTGEDRLDDIQHAIVGRLGKDGLDPVPVKGVLSCGHATVVLYAKHGVLVGPEWEDRRVSEEELPSRLVSDFSAVTIGLLPGIALASLTAVRESTHVVLDRFRADLDPAFLAHRACLANPDEAEEHMVASIASELRSVMDDAVANQEPAGKGPIVQWIGDRKNVTGSFKFGEKTLNFDETVKIATQGLGETTKSNRRFFENNLECLSVGFGGGDGEALDERLAWIMASRTILGRLRPKLWLGTVVRRTSEGTNDGEELICLRPRCDSVRLDGSTSFGFLRLGEPKKGQEQLVVGSSEAYRRRGIQWDASGWRIYAFDPSTETNAVLAQKDATTGKLAFKDACGATYEWLGELKAEFAQRMATAFANHLSRPAIDDSEWLRRSARK